MSMEFLNNSIPMDSSPRSTIACFVDIVSAAGAAKGRLKMSVVRRNADGDETEREALISTGSYKVSTLESMRANVLIPLFVGINRTGDDDAMQQVIVEAFNASLDHAKWSSNVPDLGAQVFGRANEILGRLAPWEPSADRRRSSEGRQAPSEVPTLGDELTGTSPADDVTTI